jgi:hypothetical protein
MDTEPEDIILVDFAPAPGVRGVAITRADVAEKSAEALQKAMEAIRGMARKTVRTIQSIPMAECPDKVELEFGLKLDAEAGSLLAKTGTEAAITVTLTWEHKDTPPPKAAAGFAVGSTAGNAVG